MTGRKPLIIQAEASRYLTNETSMLGICSKRLRMIPRKIADPISTCRDHDMRPSMAVFRNFNNMKIGLLITLLSCASLTACKMEREEVNHEAIPVIWNSGYKMSELLSDPIELKSKSDISSLINKQWYTEFRVTPNGTNTEKEVVIKDCSSYFGMPPNYSRTIEESEMGPYLEVAIMCQATKALSEAQSSQRTYIQTFRLEANITSILPADIAMITSTAEAEKLRTLSKNRHWSDINMPHKVEIISDTKAIYHHDAGEQELEIVGKGDVNDDGIEDILLTSRDSTNDGSYFSIRLFALTKLEKSGSFHLIKEYPY